MSRGRKYAGIYKKTKNRPKVEKTLDRRTEAGYNKNRPIVGYPTAGHGGDNIKKGEKRKRELLEIAYRQFLAKGYENTSVDDIIDEAGIAKGTYYYYFGSKEQMLEEVIEMMLDNEIADAKRILESDIPVPQKIVGIIASMRPTQDEQPIAETLHSPENIIMHEKVSRQLIDRIVPILSGAAEEGIRQGIFRCDNIPERVRVLMIVSGNLFGEYRFGESDIAVFIDMAEKLFGAEKGTMSFIRQLIRPPDKLN